MRRRKVRRCRSCGAILNGTRLLICESCQAAGMGREIRAEIDAEELLEVAIQREKMELAILEEIRKNGCKAYCEDPTACLGGGKCYYARRW